MSNTAFALSPISARATSPTEADFEAIREAFVETARGRWFLEEYTKRNRNADTALVLDAVARIERTLAAQKELKTEEPQAQPAPDLTETLVAIKAIIAAARDSAEAALSGPPMDEALAPTRKCARVIREIAWGLRESGADGRICTLLDSQVDAINAACDHVPTSGFRDHVLAAFDRAAVQIEQLGTSEEQEAEIRQPEAATVADEARSAAIETIEDTRNVSNNASAQFSNDNIAAAFDATVETSLPGDASSSDVPTDVAADIHSSPAQDTVPVETVDTVTQAPPQPAITLQADAQEGSTPAAQATETGDFGASPPADSEHIPFEAAASEVMTSENLNAKDMASEASDGIALDESLFDLAAESTAHTSSEIEAAVAVQDTASVDVMEPSAAVEASSDVTVETATEEAIQQTTPAPEPEIAASELEQNQHQAIASVAATDEITVVPQVVESLEAMADITIEETASDETLADQNATSETFAVGAQDQLPAGDTPQIAEMAEEPTEPAATVEAVVVPASDAEAGVASDVVSATSSEDTPSIASVETSSVSAKTPLPDNMLGEAIAQNSYSTASMDMPVAVETAPASMANNVMTLAAGPMPDAITPPVSLGASLIASGIVAKPEATRNDPLAAIRRMSHAERIAFFS
ncbi:hypothetical protein V1291_001351 [Nitrobacteraceae bacterium AZCC 1564]